MTLRRVAVAAGLAAALAAAAVLLLVLAGGSSGRATGPHGGRIGPQELTRVLRAGEAASAGATRAELVAEGRRLFRSAAVALDGESCQTCHTEGGANPGLGVIPHPRFEGDFKGPREAMTLIGSGRTAPYFWDARVATLNATVAATVRDHFKPERVGDDEQLGRTTMAIVAYLEELEPPATPFDQGTMSEAALRGEALFQGKAGCVACHLGPLFTDNRIHNLGVPQVPMPDGSTSTDLGAPAPALPPGEVQPFPRSAFINTPTLRDVRNTAPYMHNGSFATLRDVINFYNVQSSVAPLRLTDAEIDDLIAFLEAL